MDWHFSYLSWIYLVTAIVSAQLLLVVFSMGKIKGRTEFQWLMFLAAFWSFVLVFESAAPTIEIKVWWSQFEYFANMGIPLFLLKFILTYETERSARLRRFYWYFWIIPSIIIVLVFSNKFHHLIWTGFTWSQAGMNILTYHHGPVFFIGMAYSLLLIISSWIMLLWIVWNESDAYKSKARFLVLSSLVPLLTATCYTVGLTPIEGLNISPMGILIFGIIYLRGSAREKIFDLIPFSHQLMVEKMSDGVVVLDKSGTILDISPSALLLLKPAVSPVGRQVDQVLPLLDQVVDSNTDVEELRMEVRIDNPTGTWIEIYRFPLKDPKGAYLGNLLLLHDISKRKETESQLNKLATELIELNSMRDRLYSVIGHDLRSPFNAILGFSQLLVESYDEFSDNDRREFASNINLVARNTYELLVNLLDWSMSQLGRSKFAPEKIRLQDLVDETFKLLKFNATPKGISLISSVPADLVIHADRNMMLTIIRNLVSNGIKFSSYEGAVEILAIKRGELVDISVADNGIGMTAQEADQLFQTESLIARSGTADEQGTGLGLIISRDFVERHGGKIRVTSEPGLGSRFIITLPAGG